MPEKSGFFDSTASDVRTYPARDFADYFAQLLTSGVFNGGQYLNPTATGTNATVSLSPGYAWIKGYVYRIYATPLPLSIQPAAALPRIDRIILRLDTSLATRSIQAMIIQGVPGSNPNPPGLTRAGEVYDLSIAQIRVNANTTIITQANITDERLNNAVCGLVNSLIQVDTAVFQQQWDAFMASIISSGFATTQYVDNRVLTGGYGATTNSGNVYSVTLSPAPSALVAGLRATVRINAANTGAVTININGLGPKSVLKSNGNAMTANSLRANSVYSLVYNGTAFILQGEGGEYGTATANQVLQGYTIGTENGIVNGALIPGKKRADGVGYFQQVGTTNEYRMIVTGLEFRPTFVAVTDPQSQNIFIFVDRGGNLMANVGFRQGANTIPTYDNLTIQNNGFTLILFNRTLGNPIAWTADE